MKEGATARLPGWALARRRIRLASVPGDNLYLLRATPSSSLARDEFTYQELLNWEEHTEFFAFNEIPMGFRINLGPGPKRNIGITVAGMDVAVQGSTIAPAFTDSDLRGVYSRDVFHGEFTIEAARKSALDLWASAEYGEPGESSFVLAAREVFDRISSLVGTGSWKERKVHRYLNDHGRLLLPPHRRVLFEHRLVLGDEFRVADFILQRETAFPPLLIELENPSSPLFRKNGEFTSPAHHARSQIAEWVTFIQKDDRNVAGANEFLVGPKQRLVVMGRGFNLLNRMLDSRDTDTVMWTYDLLISEAKQRVNSDISAMAGLLRLDSYGQIP